MDNFMKKLFCGILICLFACSVLTGQSAIGNNNDSQIEDTSEIADEVSSNESEEKEDENKLDASEAGVSEVPPKKRPKKIDKEKADAAAKKDESAKDDENNRNTIRYGVASEIVTLVNKLIDNDDPRYTEEMYDVFQLTRSDSVRQVILKYFKKYEDPCLEDFAVEVVNDPYDLKNDLVKAVFEYIGAVKCKAAIPAILTLIEGENESYFNDALVCIGEIGGPKEAVYLAEYLDREDLTTVQRQSLMRVLGKMQAVETWDKLVEILEDSDENAFVRMYAAESIGLMKEEKSIEVLTKQFEANDPNLRQYVVKGLRNFQNNKDADGVILEAIRDDHYKVRLEAISAVKENKIEASVPYLIYRAKNDSEKVVKDASYDAIASLNTNDGNDFLIGQITEKKSGDTVKAKAVEVLMKYGDAGKDEIAALEKEVLTEDRRKSLRYAIGKEFGKYDRDYLAEICVDYLTSKDATTVGYGLDMFKTGRYSIAEETVRKIAEDKKASTANRARAKKMLNIEDEPDDKEKDKSAEKK